MLPKKKTSHSRSRTASGRQGDDGRQLHECPRCNSPRLPHAACDNCGFVRAGLSLKIDEES